MNMNEELKKDILSNPLHLRESYITNNYPSLHSDIIKYNIDNNLPNNITFKEKLWYYMYNIKEVCICLMCNSSVSFNKKFINGYKNYCSTKCAQQNQDTKTKRENTILETYGVDNIAKVDSIKKKTEETNIKKYGHKSSFQNSVVREKWTKNIKETHGVEHVFQLDSVKEKSKVTSVERYGVEHFVQSDGYKEKLKEMGHSENMRKIYMEITVNTNMERYGVEHYTQSDEYKAIMSDENMKEYLRSKSFENRKMRFEYTGYDLLSTTSGSTLHIKSQHCGHEFEILYECFIMRFENKHNCCLKCLPLHSISQSSMELEIRETLDKLSIVYIPNYTGLGIEIDIFIPSMNIGIEMNGLYWHSELKKHKRFHLTKTDICNKNNIHLIHVWEDDWNYKREIVESIIKNKLKIIDTKIYARKCNIKEVNIVEAREFLNKNHIQGYVNSKIKLGLYYEDKLVSLMTFGVRYINGKRNTELLRFCNLLNINIIGGASKLFTHYISNYEFDIIKSYADLSIFDGALYNTLGFKYIHRTDVSYHWVINGMRKHRFNYNKKKLIKDGFDSNKSEAEIMHERGYYRIWNCGLDLYIYENI